MRTAEIKIYSYSELSEAAKQTVKNWMFENGYFWAEEAHQSLRGLEKVFPGLSIKSSEFSTYADVNYSTGQIDDDILNLSGTRLRIWLINNVYEYLYERKPYGKYPYKRRSRIIYTETSCPFTGYCMDDDILYPIREFIKNPKPGTDMSDLIGECVKAWEESASADCQGQESDEYIEDHCEANEYEFTEDGKIF